MVGQNLPLAALFLTLGLAAVTQATQAAAKPNVIVITMDDMSRMEWRSDVMPNLFEHIVSQGMTFDQFSINTPVCGPSRATLLTGLYPHNHGVKFCSPDPGPTRKWDVYLKEGHADNDEGAQFQAGGYYTAMVGKYVNSYGGPGVMREAFGELGHENYVPLGWDDFFVPVTTDYVNWTVVENGRRTVYPDAPQNFRTDVINRRAIRAVDAAIGNRKPLLMHLQFGAPHAPITRDSPWHPERHDALFEDETLPRDPDLNANGDGKHPSIAALPPYSDAALEALDNWHRERLRSLQSADEAIGDLIQHLSMRGQLDNTYIVFLSDNGFHLGHHRLLAKLAPYERVTNVPMAIRGPGVSAHSSRDELVGMVDIHPTVLKLADLPVSRDVDGQSFAHLLSHAEPTQDWRAQMLLEHWTSSTAIRFEYGALRGPGWSYIKWWDSFEEYYDLKSDPFQLDNVFSDLPAPIKTSHRERLALLSNCTGVECHDWGTRDAAPYPLAEPASRNTPGSGRHNGIEVTGRTEPYIRIFSPARDAALTQGQTVSVQWNLQTLLNSLTLRVYVSMARQGSAEDHIVSQGLNRGRTTFVVDPECFEPGEYRLRVVSLGGGGMSHQIPVTVLP